MQKDQYSNNKIKARKERKFTSGILEFLAENFFKVFLLRNLIVKKKNHLKKMGIVDWVKQHPYLTTFGVVATVGTAVYVYVDGG